MEGQLSTGLPGATRGNPSSVVTRWNGRLWTSWSKGIWELELRGFVDSGKNMELTVGLSRYAYLKIKRAAEF